MAELIISKAAVEHNAAIIRQHIGPAQAIGVIKANGYGLGTTTLAQLLTGCGVQMLAVSELEDGLTLRRCGFEQQLLLLTPLYDARQLQQAISHNIIITLASREGIQMAEQVAEKLDCSAKAHLAIETGFGRYGFSSSKPEEVVCAASACDRLRLCGVFSHLSDSAGRKTAHTQEQYCRLLAVTKALEAAGFSGLLRHLANSTAALRFDYTHLDAVRLGSAWLGRLPLRNRWGLERVGWLRAPISDIYQQPPGINIGYGNTYRTKRPTRTAVIQAGYFHGFGLGRAHGSYRIIDLMRYVYRDLRAWLHQYCHQVEINGQLCPVLGPVGLCSLVADISAVDCQKGDYARLEVNPIFTDSSVPRIIE